VGPAPPVSVLCLGRGWRALQTSIFALAAGALGLWSAQHLGMAGPWAGLVTCACAISAAWLAWRWLAAPAIRLVWDGQQWQAGERAVGCDLMLLSARFALLRLRSVQGVTWLAVGATEAGPAWHALRVAWLAAPRPAVATTAQEGQGG
jgi:hypothetical protein